MKRVSTRKLLILLWLILTLGLLVVIGWGMATAMNDPLLVSYDDRDKSVYCGVCGKTKPLHLHHGYQHPHAKDY